MRSSWNYHNQRLELKHIPEQLIDYTRTPSGTRSVGCSELHWKNQPIEQMNGRDKKA
jgi:hypothetical protein